MTVAKTRCGSPSPVFAITSVVGLSVGIPGPSEARSSVAVSAATSNSIAACDQVAKIESEGELDAVSSSLTPLG